MDDLKQTLIGRIITHDINARLNGQSGRSDIRAHLDGLVTHYEALPMDELARIDERNAGMANKELWVREATAAKYVFAGSAVVLLAGVATLGLGDQLPSAVKSVAMFLSIVGGGMAIISGGLYVVGSVVLGNTNSPSVYNMSDSAQ